MDAAYLKQNVYGALTEALAAMTAVNPNSEDRVEFLGKYLLQYVQRKESNDLFLKEHKVVEAQYDDEVNQTRQRQVEMEAKLKQENEYKDKYSKFLESFYFGGDISTKKQAMDIANAFIAEYFDVPAVYTAMKKVVGEQEYLYYLSSCASQTEKVVGKKLVKPSFEVDPDDPSTFHQGLSFDAFIIPEVPQSDEEELDENGEPKPTPPPPPPQPVIVENVMREKRIKFFGIPKLGSFVALPFSYQSTDHENGYIPKSNDEENRNEQEEEGKADEGESSLFAESYMNQELIVAFDSIGHYRQFTIDEIDKIKKIGSAMVRIFEEIEKKSLNAHKEFLVYQATVSDSLMKELNGLKTQELELPPSAVETENENADPEAPAPLASFKPLQDSLAVLNLWNTHFKQEPLVSAVDSLHRHVLPIPQSAINLLLAIFLLTGHENADFTDEFGDITWQLIKSKGLVSLTEKISSYDPNQRNVLKEGTYENVKNFIDGNAVYDAPLPSYLPVFSVLQCWLQRALTARENAITYFREATEEDMEVVIP